MRTILIVDDEPKITRLARDYLEHSGFAVQTATDGASALAALRSAKPDLIVLDLGLPDMDGLDVTRAVRKDSNVPIVMLTARGEESDKLVGLELGADDYLTKPFSPKELVARVRAVLRRAENAREPAASGETLRVADVEFDLPRMRVLRAGQGVDLTATEFELLVTLARQPGRIFSRANCSTRCAARPLNRMSAPSTRTSRTSAASWSPTPASPATCSRFMAWATSLPKTEP
jgi:two-component system alkaline phosphatase synthesis response regulator PhoP